MSLSRDLNDSVHVVSVGVKACDAIERELQSMFIDGGKIGNGGIQQRPSERTSNFRGLLRGQTGEEEVIKAGRPARGEVRWYGATDAGLMDVRWNVRQWGMRCEIQRHAELMKEKDTSGKKVDKL